MGEKPSAQEAERNRQAYRQLDTVREIGFVFAIAATGIKLMLSDPVSLKLGEAGRQIAVSSLALVVIGVLCLLSAGVIAVQRVPLTNRLLPEGHFLRRRPVVFLAWGVGVSVVLFVVLSLGKVVSAA
jgi:hypothetical protein